MYAPPPNAERVTSVRMLKIVQLILATFDIFDTEPRTWQLDFDEFCHWLETGERSLNKFGISEAVKPVAASGMELPKGES